MGYYHDNALCGRVFAVCLLSGCIRVMDRHVPGIFSGTVEQSHLFQNILEYTRFSCRLREHENDPGPVSFRVFHVVPKMDPMAQHYFDPALGRAFCPGCALFPLDVQFRMGHDQYASVQYGGVGSAMAGAAQLGACIHMHCAYLEIHAFLGDCHDRGPYGHLQEPL